MKDMTLLDVIYKLNPGIELSEYQKQLITNLDTFRGDPCELMSEMESLEETTPELLSIKDIKNKIKYSKNPLEIKQLNRRLNAMYKGGHNYHYGNKKL